MGLPKIKKLFLVATSLSLLGATIGLQAQHGPSSAEPTMPQINLPAEPSSLEANNYPRLKHAIKESVVRFDSDEVKQNFLNTNNLSASELIPVNYLPNTYTVAKTPDKLKAAGALLSEQKTYAALLTPNDPIYPQWYTDKISAPTAWDISTGSNSIIVADIDTGFALNHEDLVGRWASGGRDFINNDGDPSAGTTNPNGEGVSHGTETAGLIGAATNNGKGVAAINWGVRILPLQALDDDGEGTTTAVATAVRYAVNQGAKVINLSLGVTSPDPILKAELDYAQSFDVLIVAAAGNCGSPSSYYLNGCSSPGQMVYPANYPQVLAVGATDSNDVRASFSSYGSNLDVVAPGTGSIRTTAWSFGNQTSAYTNSLSGTSFSTPIVAGLAALYRSYSPGASASSTASAITNSADKLNSMGGQIFASEYGYGRINAANTLRGIATSPPSPAPVPTSPETSPSPLPAPFIVVAHPDGTLVRSVSEPQVYLIIDSTRYHVPDIYTFSSHGYSWSEVKTANDKDRELPISPARLAFKSGSLVRGDSSSAVYSLRCSATSCTKDHIASLAVFVGLGLSFNEVQVVPQASVDAMASGSIITSTNLHLQDQLVLDKATGKVYLIDNSSKRWVPSLEIFAANHFSWPRVKTATAGDLVLTDGANIPFPEGALVRAHNDPAVYAINQTSPGSYEKRHIASGITFSELGYKPDEVFVVSASYLPSTSGSAIGY